MGIGVSRGESSCKKCVAWPHDRMVAWSAAPVAPCCRPVWVAFRASVRRAATKPLAFFCTCRVHRRQVGAGIASSQGWRLARIGGSRRRRKCQQRVWVASQSGRGHCAMTSIGIARVPQQRPCPAAQALRELPGHPNLPSVQSFELADESARACLCLTDRGRHTDKRGLGVHPKLGQPSESRSPSPQPITARRFWTGASPAAHPQ